MNNKLHESSQCFRTSYIRWASASLTVAGMTSLMIGLAGCQNENLPAPKTASSESADQETKPVAPADPKTRALAAKTALFERLSARLVEAMSNGGPAAAIEVCSKEAPIIADVIGKEHGLKIGRTSFKLRNASNTPPVWSQQFVDNRITEPQFLELPDNRFGAFLPILLKPQCMTCHGPQNQIDKAVLTKLNELYPDDQATGFNIDELRGWFWVEVPTGQNNS